MIRPPDRVERLPRLTSAWRGSLVRLARSPRNASYLNAGRARATATTSGVISSQLRVSERVADRASSPECHARESREVARILRRPTSRPDRSALPPSLSIAKRSTPATSRGLIGAKLNCFEKALSYRNEQGT